MGNIILFDDEENTLNVFKQLFKDFELKSTLVISDSLEKFRGSLSNKDICNNLRALIIDLAKDKNEEGTGTFEIQKDIKDNFNKYRVPIFIHSGNLAHYEEFLTNGTIYRVEKSKDSIKIICEYIKLFEESGFIDLFAPSGKIEKKLMDELHDSFTSQFIKDEIKEIINSIDKKEPERYQRRIEEIFSRISLRSLISKLLNPVSEEDFNTKINGIEHYLRRINKKDIWTGDIFKANDSEEFNISIYT